MKAYSNPIGPYVGADLKTALLEQVAEHRRLDMIEKGHYWKGNGAGTGCAIGCSMHSLMLLSGGDMFKSALATNEGQHKELADQLAIPAQLTHLQDAIFERLPDGLHLDWPGRFYTAIEPGANLSPVWPGVWLRMAEDAEHGLIARAGNNQQVIDAINGVSALYRRRLAGDEPSREDWRRAAEAAADAARAAAYADDDAAYAAADAARDAAYAAADADAYAAADAADAYAAYAAADAYIVWLADVLIEEMARCEVTA